MKRSRQPNNTTNLCPIFFHTFELLDQFSHEILETLSIFPALRLKMPQAIDGRCAASRSSGVSTALMFLSVEFRFRCLYLHAIGCFGMAVIDSMLPMNIASSWPHCQLFCVLRNGNFLTVKCPYFADACIVRVANDYRARFHNIL
jgi:hypothetical protein